MPKQFLPRGKFWEYVKHSKHFEFKYGANISTTQLILIWTLCTSETLLAEVMKRLLKLLNWYQCSSRFLYFQPKFIELRKPSEGRSSGAAIWILNINIVAGFV